MLKPINLHPQQIRTMESEKWAESHSDQSLGLQAQVLAIQNPGLKGRQKLFHYIERLLATFQAALPFSTSEFGKYVGEKM